MLRPGSHRIWWGEHFISCTRAAHAPPLQAALYPRSEHFLPAPVLTLPSPGAMLPVLIQAQSDRTGTRYIRRYLAALNEEAYSMNPEETAQVGTTADPHATNGNGSANGNGNGAT